MKVFFLPTEKDYKQYYFYLFFKKNFLSQLGLILVIITLVSVIDIGLFNNFDIKKLDIKLAIELFFLCFIYFIILYVIALRRLNNAIKTNLLTIPKTLEINAAGITISKEEKSHFWAWGDILGANIYENNFIIHFDKKQFILIPVRSFSSKNEAVVFEEEFKSNTQKNKKSTDPTKIRNLYYWGLLGIIPNLGIIIGLILIVQGIRHSKLLLAIFGIGDILLTLFFWKVIVPLLSSNGIVATSHLC